MGVLRPHRASTGAHWLTRAWMLRGKPRKPGERGRAAGLRKARGHEWVSPALPAPRREPPPIPRVLPLLPTRPAPSTAGQCPWAGGSGGLRDGREEKVPGHGGQPHEAHAGARDTGAQGTAAAGAWAGPRLLKAGRAGGAAASSSSRPFPQRRAGGGAGGPGRPRHRTAPPLAARRPRALETPPPLRPRRPGGPASPQRRALGH